ncbi:HNH endonuclease signature motif containing protein [Acetobacter thailandicus]|uniref:HNH endonuclease signature motif containing protein n=1 Tax=Acetobacter thailandicus TaxID=1502842 RepID=UPI001BA69C8A|nr:HNH endonuclease signature motif containing protein [Acetobacter thailandicus]MBS0980187.1 HNH endonuclease [Acetobacter thailandicus]
MTNKALKTTTILNTLRAEQEKQEKITQRFLRMVNKNGPISERRPELGQCWLWTGATDGKLSPYGKYTIERTTLRANRVAYILFSGLIPEGAHIDHLCGNRLCVNPAHLEAVTPLENILRAHTHATKHDTKRARLPTDCASRDRRFFDAITYEIDNLTRREIQEKTGQQDSTVGKNRKAVKEHPYIGLLVTETRKQMKQASIDHSEHTHHMNTWKKGHTQQLERHAEYAYQQSPAKEQHNHDQ